MRAAALFLLMAAAVLRAGDDRWAKDVKDPLLQKRINEAIERGVAYLKATQAPGGNWWYLTEMDVERIEETSQVGGITALALYALAASGVPADDPSIRAGLDWIVRHPQAFRSDGATATYSISLLVLALTRIDPVAHRKAIEERTGQLLDGQQNDGMWSYLCGGRRSGPPARAADREAWRKAVTGLGTPDHSNTQFAVLALWAAQSLAGVELPRKTWERERKHFLKVQMDDGGWSYRMVRRRSTPTMTAAGIVSLVYAMAALDDGEGALGRARRHPAVLKGVAAMPRIKGGGRGGAAPWANYYLTYSIERVGTVLNLDIEDWYVPGARYLVDEQGDDGRWPKQARATGRGGPPVCTYETSLALLFLTRGTLPPVKGVITESGGERREVVITPKEGFPDPATPEGLERAFGHYHAYKPEDRAGVRERFGGAGNAAPAFFIARLRDPDAAVRATAWELLEKLLDRRLLFDPAADAETRAVMLVPIDAFWARDGARYAWDAATHRFVRR